jgi:hypothetical protein
MASPTSATADGTKVSNHLSTCTVLLVRSWSHSRIARAQPTLTGLTTHSPEALDSRRIRHNVHQSLNSPSSLPSVVRSPASAVSYLHTSGWSGTRGIGIYQPAVDAAIEKLRASASTLLDPDIYVSRISRYMSSRKEMCASLTRMRRTRRDDSRPCSASNGACASSVPLSPQKINDMHFQRPHFK